MAIECWWKLQIPFYSNAIFCYVPFFWKAPQLCSWKNWIISVNFAIIEWDTFLCLGKNGITEIFFPLRAWFVSPSRRMPQRNSDPVWRRLIVKVASGWLGKSGAIFATRQKYGGMCIHFPYSSSVLRGDLDACAQIRRFIERYAHCRSGDLLEKKRKLLLPNYGHTL